MDPIADIFDRINPTEATAIRFSAEGCSVHRGEQKRELVHGPLDHGAVLAHLLSRSGKGTGNWMSSGAITSGHSLALFPGFEARWVCDQDAGIIQIHPVSRERVISL